MLEMNIKYSGHNSVLLPFWGNFLKCCYFRGDHYFRDLIAGQKINVTFGLPLLSQGPLLWEFYGKLCLSS